MSEHHTTEHPFTVRAGLDWCRICGEVEQHPIHRGEDMEQYPILRHFTTGGENTRIDRPIAELAEDMAAHLPRNAETAAGLRKLLEARDCFVRASQ